MEITHTELLRDRTSAHGFPTKLGKLGWPIGLCEGGRLNNFQRLERRVTHLERISVSENSQTRSDNCNCRNFTFYHIADELQAILDNESAIVCPSHGFRDLGRLVWLHHLSQSLLEKVVG